MGWLQGMNRNVYHEIRDPIHEFIRLDSEERAVLDSRPVQRLRNVHQLAMEYLVYPGATHKRFEHCLGVMELASRVYDTIIRSDLVNDEVRRLFREDIGNEDRRRYWRRVLRMAALCHDIGHLPFSHAAESELLPEGWTHETITAELIRSPEMQEIWQGVTPPLRTQHVVKLAVGQAKLPDEVFTDWEAILSEIIVSDAFGVDRMDYLLRDSLHAGVGYGKFDHYRLIDTMRILPKEHDSEEPTLGLKWDGLRTAEALLLARYWMFDQVYLHPVRRAYDIHLKDFLLEWLPHGHFPTSAEEFLELTDTEVLAAVRRESLNGSTLAKRIAERKHFKVIYSRDPEDLRISSDPGRAIWSGVTQEFGESRFRLDSYTTSVGPFDFPVLQSDGRITSSSLLSDLLSRIPNVAIDYVFADPDIRNEARKYVIEKREDWLKASST